MIAPCPVRMCLLCALTALQMGQMCAAPLDEFPGQITDDPQNNEDGQGADDPPPVTAWEDFLGGNDDRLVFYRSAEDDRYVVWDVVAERATELDFPERPHTDGEWAGWQDSENGLLHAISLDTGIQVQAPLPTDDIARDFYLRSVHGPRLFGEIPRGAAQNFLAIFDLITFQWHVLPDLMVNPFPFDRDATADGDWFAVWYFPPPAIADASPLLSPDDPALLAAYDTNIDAINLVTGERKPVASGMSATHTTIRPLSVVGNRVIWSEVIHGLSGYLNQSVVWAWDLDTGETVKLLELFSEVGMWNQVSAVGSSGMLVVQWVWNATGCAATAVHSLHCFDGQIYTLLEVPPGVGSGSMAQEPQFAGSLVVYQDPFTNAWTIFDPASNTFRTIDPFRP